MPAALPPPPARPRTPISTACTRPCLPKVLGGHPHPRPTCSLDPGQPSRSPRDQIAAEQDPGLERNYQLHASPGDQWGMSSPSLGGSKQRLNSSCLGTPCWMEAPGTLKGPGKLLPDLNADALTLLPSTAPGTLPGGQKKACSKSAQVGPRSQGLVPGRPVSHTLVQGLGPLLQGSLGLMKEL